MSDHGDQLRAAFKAHEYLAPDAQEVYDQVHDLSGRYRRRRHGVQAVGGAVLVSGLVAAGFAATTMHHSDTVTVLSVAAAPAATTPVADPTTTYDFSNGVPADAQKLWDAFFAAGYGYADAVRLAKLWDGPNDTDTIKAEAGQKLLDGETLPIKPLPASPVSGAGAAPETKKDLARDAFWKAGYSIDDAVELAKLWHKPLLQTKAVAGQMLLDGKDLPIKP